MPYITALKGDVLRQIRIKETADPNQSNQAFVEFIATYRDKNGQAHKLNEISRFIKHNEHWFYIDGRFK